MEKNENKKSAYIGCGFSIIGFFVVLIALLIIELLK